jgi:hypothetical protein
MYETLTCVMLVTDVSVGVICSIILIEVIRPKMSLVPC